MTDCASIDLKHHFLIAMPGLEDETFARSVVYMCEHSPRGAMGLIINKPADISMRHLFDKVDLPLRREDLMQNPVSHGGPVQTERGFVLHDPLRMDKPQEDGGSIYASTLTVPGGLEMTTSRDVLEALSNGSGPRRVLVTLGYASWGEGQLESEIDALSAALRQSRQTQRRSATISARKSVAQQNEINHLNAIVAAQRQRLADFESGQVMIELGRQLQQLSTSHDDLASTAQRVWQLEKTIRAAHAECERLAGERDALAVHARCPLIHGFQF